MDAGKPTPNLAELTRRYVDAVAQARELGEQLDAARALRQRLEEQFKQADRVRAELAATLEAEMEKRLAEGCTPGDLMVEMFPRGGAR